MERKSEEGEWVGGGASKNTDRGGMVAALFNFIGLIMVFDEMRPTKSPVFMPCRVRFSAAAKLQ